MIKSKSNGPALPREGPNDRDTSRREFSKGFGQYEIDVPTNKLFHAYGPEKSGIYADISKSGPHGRTLQEIAYKLKLQEELCATILRSGIEHGDLVQDKYGAYHLIKKVA